MCLLLYFVKKNPGELGEDSSQPSNVPFGGDSPAIDDLGGGGNRPEVAHASSVASSVASSPEGGGGE